MGGVKLSISLGVSNPSIFDVSRRVSVQKAKRCALLDLDTSWGYCSSERYFLCLPSMHFSRHASSMLAIKNQASKQGFFPAEPLDQLAPSNLRRPACTDQLPLAQSHLHRVSCTEPFAQTNLHRQTSPEPFLQSQLRSAFFHKASCAETSANSYFCRATCAEQLAQSQVHRGE